MSRITKISKYAEVDAINDLIHDCFFQIEEVTFDSTTSILSFRFLQPIPTKRSIWSEFFYTSKQLPATECFLRIHNVISYDIRDTQKVGSYDFNVLRYDPRTNAISIQTGIPIEIKIQVRRFEISVEETDTVVERSTTARH